MDNLQTNSVEKMINGISKACAVIKPTYGPSGSNVVLEDVLRPFYRVTNDGKLIIDAIHLNDPVEQIGVNILRESADKADRDSGDGRKTTMILTEAILLEAQKVKATPLEIKKSLDECLPIILKNLDEQKKIIETKDVVGVAKIACENDKIGELIGEIYQQIGKEGIIEVDNSNTFETYYEIKEGVRLRNCGLLAPQMATDNGRAVYTKPQILITTQKINNILDIDPIFRSLVERGIHEVVIFCNDISLDVLGALLHPDNRLIMKSLIIKAPTLWKDWIIEDFSKITGATIIDGTILKLKDFKPEYFGTCDKLITSREETTVIGIKDITEHLKLLEILSNADEQLKLRISWLNTKAAVLKVGANSDSELFYTSRKARDGVSAAYLALQGGVVFGAGYALGKVSDDILKQGNLLKEALLAPYFQIIENTGGGIKLSIPGAEIYDPVLVVKNAIKNAISIAGTILTANVVICINKEKATQHWSIEERKQEYATLPNKEV